MPMVHLICGSTGAGKTTYAEAVAQQTKGIRFSIDEWMTRLFVPDRPQPGHASVAWADERVERCYAQIWALAEQLIARNIDVILDLGFSRRDDRDRMRMRAAQTRAESKLHYLDVSRETRRARVLERNRHGAAGGFAISEAMFDLMDKWFEPPSDDELYGAMIVCDD